MRARRTDGNHAAIARAFERMGCAVHRTSKRDQRGDKNNNFKNAGIHQCETCGTTFKHYRKTARFCSLSCRSRSPAHLLLLDKLRLIKRKPRVSKELPNNAVCKQCGKAFRVPPGEVGKRFFCSVRCMGDSRRGVATTPRVRDIRICPHCKKNFEVTPCSKKKYCSYQCHVASGGAVRAGLAAAKMTKKYGAKKDANHKEIVHAFESMGVLVEDTSALGYGFPDLVVAFPGDMFVMLVEVKNPNTGYGRKGLNKNQRALDFEIEIVRDMDDVMRVVSLLRERQRKIYDDGVCRTT